MRRVRIEPRPNWQATVEGELEFLWHTSDEGPYWDESAYWELTAGEVDTLEAATDTLNEMVMDAVGHVIDTKQLPLFGYDEPTTEAIEQSWRNRSYQPTLYSRFDLAWDGAGQPKMLELNGDTPTSLYEASVVQYQWLEDRFGAELESETVDQFNSIHDKLLEALRKLDLYERAQVRADRTPRRKLHLTCVTPHLEDQGTVGYLERLASEAGIPTQFVPLTDIGWQESTPYEEGGFVDLRDERIKLLFKLVPWEWLINDPFGQKLLTEHRNEQIQLIEPAWKMVASNKRLLVTLWELFKHHPYLLQAESHPGLITGDYVRKPVFGREGQNVEVVMGGALVESQDGHYEDDLMVYQKRTELLQADGNYAVIGSWVIDGQSAGIGMRESRHRVTNNLGRFVPHLFKPE